MMHKTIFPTVAMFLLAAGTSSTAATQHYALTVPFSASAPALGAVDSGWKSAARADLRWDFSFRRPAYEKTEASVLSDDHFLYVAFVAKQREPIVATQLTNGEPLGADDFVRITIWPAGISGIEYRFSVNPAGTTYATSSENSAFSPNWRATAKVTSDGYVVTARIPLSVMRSDGSGTWQVQFDRQIRSSNQLLEWAYDSAQVATDTPGYAGSMEGFKQTAAHARTKSRLAVYGLADSSGSEGGAETKTGFDLSVPLGLTSSFVATYHPDASNVELDQQTISPTVFARQYAEVRPFFTQGASYYNNFTCNDCVSYPLLYTPGIPTPKTGYAVEGARGSFSFGSFEAIGDHRNDDAQTLQWKSKDQHYQFNYQRVGVDQLSLHDVADYYEVRAGNHRNFETYAILGSEHGTSVTQAGGGKYDEYGVGFYGAKGAAFLAYHDVGDQYAPVDSLTTINDVHGPSLFLVREWDFCQTCYVQSIKPTIDLQRFHDGSGRDNFTDNSLNVDLETRSQVSLILSLGSQYVRFPTTPGGFSNQNGISVTYRKNSSTPLGISYNVGAYGNGRLSSARYFTATRIARIATLSLEADGTSQRLADGTALHQWLERASVAVQIGPNQSLAFGWRRIVGAAPVFFTEPQYIDATNLSVAYHKRFGSMDFYLAYGSPSTLATRHDLLVKFIKYIGAEKGT